MPNQRACPGDISLASLSERFSVSALNDYCAFVLPRFRSYFYLFLFRLFFSFSSWVVISLVRFLTSTSASSPLTFRP
ncbi:uncharacterized protein TrAtP1_000792 [Trichoderma atroviride]|uniref:uncharacterized protein n=1 Tax=Hypocrea atroviridis TaxID=63577 RepID=UPI003330273B|nr:hypothetical protein TrAtP1_000792 [Trichoderma atroviride]